MIDNISSREIASQLRPYLEQAVPAATSFVGDLGEQLESKAASGVTGIGLHALSAIGKAIRKRRKRSKAWAAFDAAWSEAKDDDARERAARALLAADPSFAASATMLLLRRDFVRSTLAYCERLPFVELIDVQHRLEDVYVPLSLNRQGAVNETGYDQYPERGEQIQTLLASGNHIIEGPGGSGKSVFARRLVASACRKLLEDPNAAAFDQLRIPTIVAARDLTERDFTSALQAAVGSALGALELGPLPDQFFVPYAEHGHGRWLVVIDGLDEIGDIRQRIQLWDAVASLHTRAGDQFRFIVTVRPDTIGPIPPGFESWKMQPLDSAARAELAARYAGSGTATNELVLLLERPEYRQIARNPLFIAMAASVLRAGGSLPSKQYDLADAFIRHSLERAGLHVHDQLEAAAELLSVLAVERSATVADIVQTHRAVAEKLVGRIPTLQLARRLHELLQSTGLVHPVNTGVRFLHELFQTHFAALKLASAEEPTGDIWHKIDPYRIGWPTVEQLCLAWADKDRPIDLPVRSLSGFGDAGEQCGIAISAVSPSVSDATVEMLVTRTLRALEAGDVSQKGINWLTELARTREFVRARLEMIAWSEEAELGAGIEAAECLARAGCVERALPILSDMVDDYDRYFPERTRAACLLIDLGRRSEGLTALRLISEFGDEPWCRLEAALELCEREPTSSNRTWLAESARSLLELGDEHIGWDLLGRLLAIGEIDLALPSLRQKAAFPIEVGISGQLHVYDITGAALAIGEHWDRTEGKSYLERLINDPNGSLRVKAEALAILDKLGFGHEVGPLLTRLAQEAPCELDWYVIELMAHHGLEAEAWQAGQSALAHQFRKRGSSYDARKLIECMAPLGFVDELERSIRTRLSVCDDPQLAACLSLVGRSADARRILAQYLETGAADIRIEAAASLCKVGDRILGARALYSMVRNEQLSFAMRLLAAEKLHSVGESRRAAAAFLRLVRDPGIPIAERCQAAEMFCQDTIQGIYSVIQPLLEHLRQPANVKDARLIVQCIRELDDDDFHYEDVLEISGKPFDLPLGRR